MRPPNAHEARHSTLDAPYTNLHEKLPHENPSQQMDQVQWTRFYKYRAIYLPSGSAADIKYAPDALKYHDLCPKCLRLRRPVDYDTECGSCSCGEKKRKAVGGPSADLEALLAAN